MLKEVFGYAVIAWPDGSDLWVGDIHRTPEEEVAAGGKSGLHTTGPPYVTCDLRVVNLPGSAQQNADEIGAKINARYEYDPTRPHMLVAVTKPHGNGPHVHLQVHYNTRRRLA